MDKFSYEENGYNKKEVNKFISDVITQTEAIISKCKLQEKIINDLKEKLNKKDDEDLFIINNAKNNADIIVNDALLKAEKIDNERKSLEKKLKIFKRKLKLLLVDQQAIIDEIEVLEIDE